MPSGAGRVARVALPVVSLLLLAAHFYRSGLYPLVVAAIALTGLAFVARSWAGRLLGLLLLGGTVEWLRTAWTFACAARVDGTALRAARWSSWAPWPW